MIQSSDKDIKSYYKYVKNKIRKKIHVKEIIINNHFKKEAIHF